MRLRTIMFLIFCVIAVAPIALFWLSPNSRMFANELEEVSERHLTIAKGISGEIDRYHKSLVSTFMFATGQMREADRVDSLKPLLANQMVDRICIADAATGRVQAALQGSGAACPGRFAETQMQLFENLLGEARDKVVTSGAHASESGTRVFFLLQRKEGSLAVAQIDTGVIRQIAKRVRFGELGHAAVVDQHGKVLSHPNPEWERERHDLSGVSVIQRMADQGAGVETFYSPDLKVDVIAGFASVKPVGWGVLVAQPIKELQTKADNLKATGFTVLAFGVFLAGVLAYIAAKILTHPIEQMVQSMNRIGAGELRAYEHIKQQRWHPREFNAAREGIRAMSERLQENIDTISRHAYLDGITGLPNRECFRVLAQEEIENMQASGGTCAILFLDLDGFKQVNDIYGHRSGDDLLKGFASKLHNYCGYVMKQNARGADNALRILPARLGGDEFVVMLSNLSDKTFPGKFADGLFKKVFGPYTIHNGVTLDVGGSVGGALFPDQAGDFDELLRLADIAMYAAKNGGKGRYCQYSQEQENAKPAASLAPAMDA